MSEVPRPTSRRMEVLRSITIVSVSTYVEYALGLLVSVWIARSLGPTEFGQYAFTIWLCGWLIVCSNHALTTSSTKFIAEADGAGLPGVAAGIAHKLNNTQHASSLIVMVLFAIGTLIIRPGEWHALLLPVTALVIVAVVAKANYGMVVAIEKGQERFEPEAIATVATGVVTAALVLAAMLAHAGLLAFIAIFAISSLTINLINRIAYRHYCQPFHPHPIPPDTGRRLTRHLRQTAMLVLVGSFKAGTIEVFLLTTYATSAAVGFYAIAVTLTRGAVQLFSVGLTSTLLPYMAKSFGERGQEHAARFLGEATRFYWAVGIVIAGLGYVTTPQIVQLMYGTRYLEAVPAIQAILVLAGLLLIGNGIAAFQTVVDRQKDRVMVTVLTLVANAILGIALIPHLALPGAVITTAGTGIAAIALSVYYLRKATRGGIPVAPMLRLFAVGLVATGVAWLVVRMLPGHYGFIPASLVFMAAYLPGSVLMQYWTAEDYRLMSLIANRLGRPGQRFARVLDGFHAKASS